jgi:hypothetical protein
MTWNRKVTEKKINQYKKHKEKMIRKKERRNEEYEAQRKTITKLND